LSLPPPPQATSKLPAATATAVLTKKLRRLVSTDILETPYKRPAITGPEYDETMKRASQSLNAFDLLPTQPADAAQPARQTHLATTFWRFGFVATIADSKSLGHERRIHLLKTSAYFDKLTAV
jgi:hypothetical protein